MNTLYPERGYEIALVHNDRGFKCNHHLLNLKLVLHALYVPIKMSSIYVFCHQCLQHSVVLLYYLIICFDVKKITKSSTRVLYFWKYAHVLSNTVMLQPRCLSSA